MYRKKGRIGQRKIKFVSLEDLGPEDRLLCKIDAAIRFDFICEKVKGGMYAKS